MNLILYVAAGGAIGASARFLINQAFAARGLTEFPWHTLTINVAGSLLMGIFFVLLSERLHGSPEWRSFFATGILGGFTTFSAFSLEVVGLMTDVNGSGMRPLAYIAASVGLSVAAVFAGIWLARTGLSA